MAGKVVSSRPTSTIEYELYEGDPDNLRTVVVSSNQSTPWIEPAKIKFRHRIGRGPFGDVWLATLHQSTEDYDEFHEVAVKMLHPIKEDDMRVLLDRFDDLFLKREGIESVSLLHGVSVVNGKMCIVMKFYEGSIGDRMARLKKGKLPLCDVLRHGIELAQGISELHSKGLLVLNLKPSNFLLNENNQALLGDTGVPYLLLGIPSPSADMSRRLGTVNYMAPEQWQPELRGPISFETDSWGFGCSIVEMLTGTPPWCGRSVEEIFDSVVLKQEKPHIPEGLPPPVENLLHGCFDYDFRNRPLMTDILRVFKSSQNAAYIDGSWTGLGSIVVSDRPGGSDHTEWFLSKDHLEVRDMVRSRRPPNSRKPENMDIPEGIVVGLEHESDRGCFVLVRVHGIHDPLRVHASALERVTSGLAAGDWVRLKKEDRKHSPVGVLHAIDRLGNVAAGFIGVETLWRGNSSELQMAESYFVGQFVRVKANVLSPRFEWPRKSREEWATGKIWWILPNGCLVVKFPGRLPFGDKQSSFLADPAEVEAVSFDTCPGMVKKYQHLEDFHWAVRPLVVALGLFTAMKLGCFVGKKARRSKVNNKQQNAIVPSDGHCTDGQTRGSNGNPAWLPSILGGGSNAASR